MDGIIILEVPVSFHPPRAWYAWSWGEAAERVAGRDGQTPDITPFTADQLEASYGNDVPPEALGICRQHGSVVQVIRRPDKVEWCAPADAPSWAEVVQDWIKRDNYLVRFFESGEEVEAFLEEDHSFKHRGFAAARAVEETAKDREWLLEGDLLIATFAELTHRALWDFVQEERANHDTPPVLRVSYRRTDRSADVMVIGSPSAIMYLIGRIAANGFDNLISVTQGTDC